MEFIYTKSRGLGGCKVAFDIRCCRFSFYLNPDPFSPTLRYTVMSTSTTGHTAHSERPERSRNAKAQARHRAKRKAYIDQVSVAECLQAA